MARSFWWGLIVFLHWPFCVYLATIASDVTADDEFNPDNNGIPAASPDDGDKAGNVSIFICVVAAGFGTVTDLIDLIISFGFLAPHQVKLEKFLATTRNDRSDRTPPPRTPLLKSRYLIVVLRFIMTCFWISVLIWGLVPTNVLMYIDIDPDSDIEGDSYPYYSNSVIGFISALLLFDFISFMAPLIQRCLLYFFLQKFQSVSKMREAGKQPADGHREIGSVGLEQLKSAGSIPIGHMLSVEDV